MERRGSRLSRRQFVVGAGALGLVAGCGRLPGQQAARVPRIGFLAPGSREGRAPLIEGLLEGLRELGYADGQNIAIEYRASLPRTGNNVTGMSLVSAQLMGKHLELLKLIVPNLSLVGLFANPNNPVSGPQSHEMEISTGVLGIQLQKLVVRQAEDFEAAFEAATIGHVQALVVPSDALNTNNRASIAGLAAKHQLPAIYDYREFVDVGGLVSYGPNLRDSYRRSATYVDKILRGANPINLPVQQPMTFDFVVNLKTAQALGLTFPHEIMLQVTEVIQ